MKLLKRRSRNAGYPSNEVQERAQAFLDAAYGGVVEIPREEARKTIGQLLIDAYREGFAEACQPEDDDFPLPERQCDADAGEACEACQ